MSPSAALNASEAPSFSPGAGSPGHLLANRQHHVRGGASVTIGAVEIQEESILRGLRGDVQRQVRDVSDRIVGYRWISVGDLARCRALGIRDEDSRLAGSQRLDGEGSDGDRENQLPRLESAGEELRDLPGLVVEGARAQHFEGRLVDGGVQVE